MTAKKAAPKKAVAKKAPARRPRPRPTKVTARDRQVLERRRKGTPFATIATQLKFRDRDEVYAAYERALAETLSEPSDAQRRAVLDQLDQKIEPLWAKASAGDVAAITELADLQMQRSQVVGAGSPLQLEVNTEREPGPIEKGTAAEIERLRQVHHPLSAAALVLARCVDEGAGDSPVALATVNRELRQTLNNLHAVAGDAVPHPVQSGPHERVVVPESRLTALRERSGARGSSR